MNRPEKTLRFHVDHLGTPRLVTGNGGAEVSRHAYFPFGYEATDSSSAERLRFTGHERDHPNVDYMHARYYQAGWGRFLAVDPVMQVKRAMKHPQMWNRYSYAANNPLKYIDPSGKVLELSSSCANQKTTCKELANLRNTVPAELRMFVRATTAKDGKTILDARLLNTKSGATSGNFQALREIANSSGVATFNSSTTNVQSRLGSETIGLNGASSGITFTSRQSSSGRIEAYVGGDLNAREAAETTAHELRHVRLLLLGRPAKDEWTTTFTQGHGGMSLEYHLDPNGPVNMETQSAEREAEENYDPFVPPHE